MYRREIALAAALHEIRDLLPVPPRAGVLRDLYIDMLGSAGAVAAYVSAHLQAGEDAEKVRRDAGLRRRHDDPLLAAPPSTDVGAEVELEAQDSYATAI